MNVSLSQAAAAMNANARWQEVIAENLAASFVPGARKQQVSFSAVEAGAPSNSTAVPACPTKRHTSRSALSPSAAAHPAPHKTITPHFS